MKFFLTLLIGAFSVQLYAGDVIIKPFKVKLESVEKHLDFSQLKAVYNVECWYKKFSMGGDIFDPSVGGHRQRCGESYGDYIKINENNEIEVPAIKAYSGLRGKNLNNYKVTIYLSKESKFGGTTYMKLLLEGKKVISEYVNNPKTVLFHTVKLRDIDVNYKGEDFFKSEAAKVKGVMLALHFQKDVYTNNKTDPSEQPFLSGELQSSFWVSSDSYMSSSGIQANPAPKDLTAIKFTKEISFPVFENQKIEKQDVELTLSYEIPQALNSYKIVLRGSAAFSIDLTKEALESISVINLQENTNPETNR